jgi:hypothetical protein
LRVFRNSAVVSLPKFFWVSGSGATSLLVEKTRDNRDMALLLL